MEKLLDAYAAWPAQQQMIFAVVALIIASMLSFVWGWWLMMFARDFVYYLSVWFRGWPDETSAPTMPTVEGSPDKPWRHLLAWFSWRSASPTGAPETTLLHRELQEPPRPLPPATTQGQRITRAKRRQPQPTLATDATEPATTVETP